MVGGGGREHALCKAIAASPRCAALYCAPGNAGIAELAECVPIPIDDIEGLVAFSANQAIDFVIVGPEAPLVAGLVDRLEEVGVRAFGPSAAAAQLEGSKGFMKDFCTRHAIPTAAYGRFDSAEAAHRFIRDRGAPLVVKADGLAAGKGVILAQSVAEAEAAVTALMTDHAFGSAGDEVVIEAFLEGEEVSFFALVDGKSAVALASAQDHKRAGDGDTGPNTGGMGAYSPAPVMTDALAEDVMARIIRPTVAGMAAEGNPFKGVLFAGLMIDQSGPRLLEFNTRFGDPECQVLAARLQSDFLDALLAAEAGTLDQIDMIWRDEAALCVVMATKGYPGAYGTGSEIKGLDAAEQIEGVTILHAGTTRVEGKLCAAGGRVLGVTARAPTVAEARKRAYEAVDRIDWPKGFCRRDIGWRAVAGDA